MKFRRRARPDSSIELTPLIDVVFLLLIFFMVSTTFIRETELEVQLPEASAEVREPDDNVIEVTIAADGAFAVNNRLLVNNQLETLMKALREVSDGDTKRRLVITADADARHQDVITAMDAAGQLGLTQLSITTRNPAETPSG
jgi:biopolymer transport protein ExbD